MEAKQQIKTFVDTAEEYKDINALSPKPKKPTAKQVELWGRTSKDLSYYVKTLGIQLKLCSITSGFVRSEASNELNMREFMTFRVNRTELLKSLVNTNCRIICKFINIYKKTSQIGVGPISVKMVNHKNVLIIDKYNKMIIRFEPKQKKALIPSLRFTMNKERVMSELGIKSIETEL